MACDPVDSITAEWSADHKNIVCSWVDTGKDRVKYQLGLEGEPWGPAHPETIRYGETDQTERVFIFPGMGKWFGEVMRVWIMAKCKNCTESEAVTSSDLPIK
jgi:hypothetical protein